MLSDQRPDRGNVVQSFYKRIHFFTSGFLLDKFLPHVTVINMKNTENKGGGKTMTVYDCANELAREMRATREFSVLKEAKNKLASEPDTKVLVTKFMQLGQEVEIARYQKKEVPADKQEELDKLMRTLSLNPLAMDYLNAFQRFQLMFQDVSKTITDVVKEVAE